jgi:hypothetical protein
MPWMNGRFYANPLFGPALERARMANSGRIWSEQYPELEFQSSAEQTASHGTPGQPPPSQPPTQTGPKQQSDSGHWVTIDGKHVLVHESQGKSAQGHLSQRDKAYLDKYYDAVNKLAKKYNVDPTLVLGLGIESGFASQGTYLRTGDAFGMTGGNTKHMTTAASPDEDVEKFFANYGEQIQGAGSDTSAFINGLEGRDAFGKLVRGQKVYNTLNPDWPTDVRNGVDQMKRSVPAYMSLRNAQKVTK